VCFGLFFRLKLKGTYMTRFWSNGYAITTIVAEGKDGDGDKTNHCIPVHNQVARKGESKTTIVRQTA
jgi:hypothetical protein